MEQPCYKCGQMVEEGRMFCPNCRAPQIRVLVAEPVAAASLAQLTEPSNEDILPASQTVPVLALPVQWSHALKPCFLAALAASVLMLLGLHPFVVMPGAGFLAVLFYRQGQPNLAVRTGVSIRIGAFSGLLSSGFMVLMTAMAATIPDLRIKMHDQLLEKAQQSFASQTDNPVLRYLLSQLRTPDRFVLVLIILCGLAVVLSIILGGIGGAAAGAIFGRRPR
jgi:hypothetical protein